MHNVFQTYHPSVAFAFMVSALVLSMVGLHPIYAPLSLVGALVCSVVTRGVKPTALSLRWIVPLCLIVTVANPLFTSAGSTELLHLGSRVVYAEALAYGLCSGMMFASVFLWFSCYSVCMDSAHSLALTGNVAPVITLMVSQVLRLMPQFVSRGRTITNVQMANSAATATTALQKTKERTRIVSVLMSWGMEDGIMRSDAMRARGYDCGIRRTTYKRYKYTQVDACILGCIGLLAVVSLALELGATLQYEFYPVMTSIQPWWAYVSYGCFMGIPVVLQIKEWWQWRSLQ